MGVVKNNKSSDNYQKIRNGERQESNKCGERGEHMLGGILLVSRLNLRIKKDEVLNKEASNREGLFRSCFRGNGWGPLDPRGDKKKDEKKGPLSQGEKK